MPKFVYISQRTTFRLNNEVKSVNTFNGRNRYYSENHTEHINTLSGQKVEILNVTACGNGANITGI